jgi:hypothetical protein
MLVGGKVGHFRGSENPETLTSPIIELKVLGNNGFGLLRSYECFYRMLVVVPAYQGHLIASYPINI